jgi:phosphoenolpyruvate carboxykinase (ATP)
MFRPIPQDADKSVFANDPFYLIALPYDKLDRTKYEGRLRKLPDGKTSDMAIVMDFDRRFGIVYGSAYGGSVKKLMFTVMNYLLPEKGILPLHCSANEGKNGDSALLLGLSGTGKTTLSADPERALLGDDEHGWNDNGIANFENGCYAKLINLKKEKEPEIFNAVFHEDHYLNHGVIIENCMMYPDGRFDVDDDRLTQNSRASYPLVYLSNIKPDSKSGHPKTILFLTADANSVLPPVAKLNPEQAMLWFLMGYTSKLAGTETGITEPVSTFSRFFGEPFMPRNPDVYAKMLGEKMQKHGTNVYLINTGWSGGPYGIGKRMDINITRRLVEAALKGELEDVEYKEDKLFHLSIPLSCPGVPSEILDPKNTWEDKEAYEKRAKKLAADFSNHFDKAYGNKNIGHEIEKQCPGK